MKKMSKPLALLLAGMMVFGTACGSSNSTGSSGAAREQQKLRKALPQMEQ